MKNANYLLCYAALSCALLSAGASASPLGDTLSRAADQLGAQSATQQGGVSLSTLTSLLNGNNNALSASNMNNAAGVMQYCASQKLSAVNDTQNMKTMVLTKLGLISPKEQRQDNEYITGLQGVLNAQNGQLLNLRSLGNSELGRKVQSKACTLILKQAANFIS